MNIDKEFMKEIGAKGGSRKVKKGFACMEPGLHKKYSAKGGRISRYDRKAV